MVVTLSAKSRFCSHFTAAAAAKSLQSCPTLCDPMDYSPPAPPSMGFSRQEYWSGVPLPTPPFYRGGCKGPEKGTAQDPELQSDFGLRALA